MNPTTGTFLSVDPVVPSISDPQSLNAYAYARNNPVNVVDPTGMIFEFWYGQVPAGMSPGQFTNGFDAQFSDPGMFADSGAAPGMFVSDFMSGSSPPSFSGFLSGIAGSFSAIPGASQIVNVASGIGDALKGPAGFLWSLPNTLIGLAYGITGMALGAAASIAWGALHVATIGRLGGFGWFGGGLRFADGQLQFTGSALQRGLSWVFTGGDTGAITLGDVGVYPSNFGPTDVNPSTGQDLGFEEGFHSQQARVLGPLYLPANIVGGIRALIHDGYWHGPANFMERGPHAVPPRRF